MAKKIIKAPAKIRIGLRYISDKCIICGREIPEGENVCRKCSKEKSFEEIFDSI